MTFWARWRTAIIAGLITLLPGIWIAHNLHAGPISAAKAAIDANQAQLDQIRALVARIPALRATYVRLAHLYKPPTASTSYWQSTFVRTIDREAALRHVDINELAWTAPPPQSTPIPVDLLGNGNDATNFATLFTDLACNITVSGRWRDLLPLIADLPKRSLLLAVSSPTIATATAGTALQLKLHGDLLVAHVTAINDPALASHRTLSMRPSTRPARPVRPVRPVRPLRKEHRP